MISLSTARRGLFGLAAALGLTLGGAAWAADAMPKNVDDDGLALRGYDPVAYFEEGAPTRGSAEHSATFDGATYHFATAANREAFEADPARFVPAYGGYCAFGTAMGRKFDGDPEVWKIVDDKLYLNLNPGVQKRWEGNIPGFVDTADHNWSLIENVADATLATEAPAGVRLGAAQ